MQGLTASPPQVVYVGCQGSYLLWWVVHGLPQPHWCAQAAAVSFARAVPTCVWSSSASARCDQRAPPKSRGPLLQVLDRVCGQVPPREGGPPVPGGVRGEPWSSGSACDPRFRPLTVASQVLYVLPG